MNGSTLRPSAADDERHPLRHQAGDEGDVAARSRSSLATTIRIWPSWPPSAPPSAAAGDRAHRHPCRSRSRRTRRRSRSLPPRRSGDGLALRFEAEARAALLLGGDAIVGDERGHLRRSLCRIDQRICDTKPVRLQAPPLNRGGCAQLAPSSSSTRKGISPAGNFLFSSPGPTVAFGTFASPRQSACAASAFRFSSRAAHPPVVASHDRRQVPGRGRVRGKTRFRFRLRGLPWSLLARPIFSTVLHFASCYSPRYGPHLDHPPA